MENVRDFYLELSPIIAKSKIPLDTLCRESFASKVTIWRWINSINKKYPDPHKVLSVLSRISGKKEIDDIAGHYGGEIQNFLEGQFGINRIF
ncbi:MAG: hypothetical protein DRQ88_07270 [Epsilonproteobacteria bacterium]|nr:MAG: hypothetical protein DRQ89_03145 [Campylobacterota bacterium]RLA66282.1 MAG: hypothetical protein DRQ88_07270 [Campylobacterota bacterium]